MPAKTFTANASTNQLTCTGHGCVTGGPSVILYAVDASVLPAPLAEGTEYAPIVIDANTLKLAPIAAYAVNQLAIDLTTAGSGTLVLVKVPG